MKPAEKARKNIFRILLRNTKFSLFIGLTRDNKFFFMKYEMNFMKNTKFQGYER